jgi:hypothetical protein
MYIEPVYCFNCDNEAVVYVDCSYPNVESLHRTFMCRTCADAFEFGQCTSEGVHSIDELEELDK